MKRQNPYHGGIDDDTSIAANWRRSLNNAYWIVRVT